MREKVRPGLLEAVRSHPAVQAYLHLADRHLAELGFTEHGERHASLTSAIARNILERLGYGAHLAELAAVAGYLHDVGNVAGREGHTWVGALIAMRVLEELGLSPEDIGVVMGAIGNHEEPHGQAVSPVAAAVVLADKSDVHRSRVRKPDAVAFDIHDRVNYAARHSFLRVDPEARTLTLELEIDTEVAPVMEYFEIFLERMVMCRRAAEALGGRFRLMVNGVSLL